MQRENFLGLRINPEAKQAPKARQPQKTKPWVNGTGGGGTFLLLCVQESAHKQPNQVSGAQNAGKYQREILHPENIGGSIHGGNQTKIIENNAVSNGISRAGGAEDAGQNNLLQSGVLHRKTLL